MNKQHHYSLNITWTGNKGTGTSNYRAYERSHTISLANKIDILGTSDTAFNGDQTKHSPEDLFLASIAACHMLWYLYLCAEAGIVVTAYTDNAKGVMVQSSDGGGYFTEVTLYPAITLSDEGKVEKATALHHIAHKRCYIANSCNFPIYHQPTFKIQT